MPIHYGCNNSEILQEIQENDVRRDDEISAEYAHTLVERVGSSNYHLRGIRLSKIV
jgi:hypothetical protein